MPLNETMSATVARDMAHEPSDGLASHSWLPGTRRLELLPSKDVKILCVPSSSSGPNTIPIQPTLALCFCLGQARLG
jgi:hypothetical protein